MIRMGAYSTNVWSPSTVSPFRDRLQFARPMSLGTAGLWLLPRRLGQLGFHRPETIGSRRATPT